MTDNMAGSRRKGYYIEYVSFEGLGAAAVVTSNHFERAPCDRDIGEAGHSYLPKYLKKTRHLVLREMALAHNEYKRYFQLVRISGDGVALQAGTATSDV